MARRALTDFMATSAVQPPLIDHATLVAREQPARRKPGTAKKPAIPERDILKAILQSLAMHPLVAKVERTGVYRGRVVRPNGSIGYAKAGQSGMADICGKLKDGRKFAIEVKRPSTRKNVTDQQREFLDDYIKRGDLAGVATSVEEAVAIVDGRA